MSITDELMEWAVQPIRDFEQLGGIAARVEKVEQRAEELEHALEDAHARLEQWRANAVMLPTDAEGVPFRTGDHVQVPGGLPDEGLPPVRGTIERMTLRKTGWLVRVFADGKGRVFLPEFVSHAKTDTFDAIISDAVNSGTPDIDALVKRCERVAARQVGGNEG